MSITLPFELERLVQEKIKSAAYHSSDEVLQKSLRLLEERDRNLAALRADIQIGIDQLDRGEGVDADVVFAELSVKYAPAAR
ncbi:MAG: hypothetical protein A2516_11370 [Alphaproteobacteria bacterium RIFOXYD12_FULL_60_8]|nr:MAG: hypothetical protein A2516_11370 [Alphaproteobacteria bacterium RIFOXYD12_FULL_60_8]